MDRAEQELRPQLESRAAPARIGRPPSRPDGPRPARAPRSRGCQKELSPSELGAPAVTVVAGLSRQQRQRHQQQHGAGSWASQDHGDCQAPPAKPKPETLTPASWHATPGPAPFAVKESSDRRFTATVPRSSAWPAPRPTAPRVGYLMTSQEGKTDNGAVGVQVTLGTTLRRVTPLGHGPGAGADDEDPGSAFARLPLLGVAGRQYLPSAAVPQLG